MSGETILIVDDDEDIREIISIYLENEGYHVILAADGKEALNYVFSVKLDLIILDMMLPGLDGIEVCQELRKEVSTPVIFLSCKSTSDDKTMGLMAGGDDYMSKPFDTGELIARVKAHLRRNRMLRQVETDNTFERLIFFPGLTIDLDSHTVLLEGEEVAFSPKEFQLLVLLTQNPDIVFSSEELYQKLWGAESLGDYRTLMVHISKVRKKIKQNSDKSISIQTIKGVGYKFCTG
ncbi:response regulator transcription factor [Halocella sp. SP3-1]|uniref:response regulator transcription factor n=1 Tax=Halocella sp. SP3-1 TaxID=2382161 RepID=UPI000F765433|nr:response regulator transcription factor [Halocella sp. SP3-1]AZO95864.1 DNA-binding response regulator [Halocella sp. SP3-1]